MQERIERITDKLKEIDRVILDEKNVSVVDACRTPLISIGEEIANCSGNFDKQEEDLEDLSNESKDHQSKGLPKSWDDSAKYDNEQSHKNLQKLFFKKQRGFLSENVIRQPSMDSDERHRLLGMTFLRWSRGISSKYIHQRVGILKGIERLDNEIKEHENKRETAKARKEALMDELSSKEGRQFITKGQLTRIEEKIEKLKENQKEFPEKIEELKCEQLKLRKEIIKSEELVEEKDKESITQLEQGDQTLPSFIEKINLWPRSTKQLKEEKEKEVVDKSQQVQQETIQESERRLMEESKLSVKKFNSISKVLDELDVMLAEVNKKYSSDIGYGTLREYMGLIKKHILSEGPDSDIIESRELVSRFVNDPMIRIFRDIPEQVHKLYDEREAECNSRFETIKEYQQSKVREEHEVVTEKLQEINKMIIGLEKCKSYFEKSLEIIKTEEELVEIPDSLEEAEFQQKDIEQQLKEINEEVIALSDKVRAERKIIERLDEKAKEENLEGKRKFLETKLQGLDDYHRLDRKGINIQIENDKDVFPRISKLLTLSGSLQKENLETELKGSEIRAALIRVDHSISEFVLTGETKELKESLTVFAQELINSGIELHVPQEKENLFILGGISGSLKEMFDLIVEMSLIPEGTREKLKQDMEAIPKSISEAKKDGRNIHLYSQESKQEPLWEIQEVREELELVVPPLQNNQKNRVNLNKIKEFVQPRDYWMDTVTSHNPFNPSCRPTGVIEMASYLDDLESKRDLSQEEIAEILNKLKSIAGNRLNKVDLSCFYSVFSFFQNREDRRLGQRHQKTQGFYETVVEAEELDDIVNYISNPKGEKAEKLNEASVSADGDNSHKAPRIN